MPVLQTCEAGGDIWQRQTGIQAIASPFQQASTQPRAMNCLHVFLDGWMI